MALVVATSRDVLLDQIREYLPDNLTQLITPAALRSVLNAMVMQGLIKGTDTLSVNQLRGGIHIKATLAARDAISGNLRVVGMGCVVFNPAGPAEIAAGITLPEASFVLVRDSSGDVMALVNAEPGTVATTKARWVLASGSEQQKIASYPELVLEDHNYAKDDPVQFTFPDGVVRLFKARKALTTFNIPAPTGFDNDPNWVAFAPLQAGLKFSDLQGLLLQTLTLTDVQQAASLGKLPFPCTLRITGRGVDANAEQDGQLLPVVIVTALTAHALAEQEAYLENADTTLTPVVFDLATNTTSARGGETASLVRYIGDPANNNVMLGAVDAGNMILASDNNTIAFGQANMIAQGYGNGIDKSLDCTVSGVYNNVYSSEGCTIPLSCSYVTLLNCSGFTVPEGTSHTTYINNAVPGTGSGGGSTAWADITGKPNTFTPSAHGHPISQVTGLTASLSGKADLVGGLVPLAQLPPPVNRLCYSFPAGQTSPFSIKIAFLDQAGTYALELNSNVSTFTVTKNGTPVASPYTVVVTDVLTVTGTTPAGQAGYLVLRSS